MCHDNWAGCCFDPIQRRLLIAVREVDQNSETIHFSNKSPTVQRQWHLCVFPVAASDFASIVVSQLQDSETEIVESPKIVKPALLRIPRPFKNGRILAIQHHRKTARISCQLKVRNTPNNLERCIRSMGCIGPVPELGQRGDLGSRYNRQVDHTACHTGRENLSKISRRSTICQRIEGIRARCACSERAEYLAGHERHATYREHRK